MPKTSHVFSIVTLLLVMLVSSAAWAATVTGTVTTSTTGRIYLVLLPPWGGAPNFGTSIPGPGPYTITGVPQGNYTVHAFVDRVGTGVQHANDPRGTSAEVAVPATGTATVPTFALTAPTTAVLPNVPAVGVFGGTGVNYVKWDAGLGDSNGYPRADRYTVRWSTSITGSNPSEEVEVDSGFGDYYLHRGAGSLYYQVTAYGGGVSRPSEWVQVVNPGATLGSVTGTVSFPGVTAPAPLYVILVNESAGYARVAVVPNATSPASYTVGMVPPGRYNIITFLDRNNNGSYDVGDAGLRDTNDYRPNVTVAGGPVTAPTVTLDGRNASTMITIGHGINDAAEEWFNLVVSVHSMARQVVGVEVAGTGVTASRLPQPVDLANQGNHFRTRIPMARQNPNDPYLLTITYADSSTPEVVTERVSAVLDSFAVPVAPVGYTAFSANPTFSWNLPSPALGTDYVYTLWVTGPNGASAWNAWRLPSSTTSVVYGNGGGNEVPLVNGDRYSWMLTLTDVNGNLTTREVSFFSPTSSAGVNSFAPIGGPTGTTVTITGINFPANPVVRFSGTTTNATVTAATSNTITAVVPAGATTGPITVLSGSRPGASVKPFTVAQLLTINGVVRNAAGTAIPGARVEIFGDPNNRFVLTGADGRFALNSILPGEDVTLRITATGYVPTYSATFADVAATLTLDYPFHLYTPTQFNGWNTTSGRGMLAIQVLNSGTEPNAPVAGAAGSARSAATANFPVSYFDGQNVTGTSTAANGTFLVPNIPNDERVTVGGARTGWTFFPLEYVVRAGGVTEGPLMASAGTAPSIGSFTPLSGKRGSTVVITGANFSTVPGENIVEFGTVRADVTAATATTLTVRVPATATTSRIRVTRAGMPSEPSFDTYTVLYTLNVTVAGNGTVTSVPAGISCVGGTSTAGCTANFPSTSRVQLAPTGNAGAVLTAWGQSCSGTGICEVVMDADNKAVTATFSSGTSLIRIGTTPYATPQAAFNAVTNGAVIRMQAGQYPVTSLIYHIDAAAEVAGGYDSTFTTNNDFSTLIGYLYIQNGTLTVDRLKIR